MKDKLHKMMAKKRDLMPHEKKAKMDVVKDLRGVASDMLGDEMDGLKKVSVMSNSKEGLRAGLDKARHVMSDGEEHQMQKDAEAPYSDYRKAIEEHEGEHGGNDMGYADGGPVVDPTKIQSAQDSMRKAFGYNEGGEVNEAHDDDQEDPNDEESEESAEHEASESPEEEAAEQEDEFHGLDMDQVDEKLQKLMEMKRKMESQS